MENEVLLYVSNNRNYAYDLKAANSTLLLHPMAKASDDITYFASSYTDNVQMMQLSTSDALAGAMTEDIKSKGWLLFSNIVGANDTNMLSDNYSGLVGMINKRINVVQTDYAELAAKYLKSKSIDNPQSIDDKNEYEKLSDNRNYFAVSFPLVCR